MQAVSELMLEYLFKDRNVKVCATDEIIEGNFRKAENGNMHIMNVNGTQFVVSVHCYNMIGLEV